MNGDDMIYDLFSSREREKIIRLLLDNPSKPYQVREVSRNLKISSGGVSGYFSYLTKAGILKRSRNAFRVKTDHPFTKVLKIFINVSRLQTGVVNKISGMTGMGVYGSWANGTNHENSDIDMWVKTKKRVPEEIVANVSSILSRKMKRNVQLIVLDPEKNNALRENDPIFYYSLVYGSVVLYGKSVTD